MELEGSSLNTVLALKAKKAADEANERIDNLPKGVNYKGSVNYFNDLPTDAENGDMYTVKYKGTTGTTPDGREFIWGNDDGTLKWIEIGGESKLVEVTYGVTTYNEVKAIVDGGKIPYVRKGAVIYYLHRSVVGQIEFASPMFGDTRYIVYLNNTNVWTENSSYAYEMRANKETTLTPSSTTKYPSSKAVADYVAQQIGNAIGGNY